MIYNAIKYTYINFFSHKNFLKSASNMSIKLAKLYISLSIKFITKNFLLMMKVRLSWLFLRQLKTHKVSFVFNAIVKLSMWTLLKIRQILIY